MRKKEMLYRKYIEERNKNEAIAAAKQATDQLYEMLCKVIGNEAIYGKIKNIQAIVTTSRTAHTGDNVMPIQRYIDIEVRDVNRE